MNGIDQFGAVMKSLTIPSLVLLSTLVSNASVVISEIMYNPGSSESAPGYAEWIEITNNGSSSVNISGWTIKDEDGTSTISIPPTVFIAPLESVVLFDDDSTVSEFQAAWGSGYQLFALNFNSLSGLSNSPSSTSEILTLIDDNSATVDIANYDDSGDWPSEGTWSIYLTAGNFNPVANDDGSNWASSAAGVDGAYNATGVGNFSASDIGSPGTSPVPEPTIALLGSLGLFGLLRRRR